MTAGSSGMTVPYATGADAAGASVEVDSAVGEPVSAGAIVGVSAGSVPAAAGSSVCGAQAARIELAAIKLPVTEAISFSASRLDILPSV